MSDAFDFSGLTEEPAGLDRTHSDFNEHRGSTYATFETQDGRYTVEVNNDGIREEDPEMGVSVIGPVMELEDSEEYRQMLEESEGYDEIEPVSSDHSVVLLFNSIDTAPADHASPKPEYVDALFEGDLRSIKQEEPSERERNWEGLNQIAFALKAGNMFDTVEEVNMYSDSVIQDMEEIYEKL